MPNDNVFCERAGLPTPKATPLTTLRAHGCICFFAQVRQNTCTTEGMCFRRRIFAMLLLKFKPLHCGEAWPDFGAATRNGGGRDLCSAGGHTRKLRQTPSTAAAQRPVPGTGLRQSCRRDGQPNQVAGPVAVGPVPGRCGRALWQGRPARSRGTLGKEPPKSIGVF